MRRVLRTTNGFFLKDERRVYALGDVPTEGLLDAIEKADGSGNAEVTGQPLAPVDPRTIWLVGLNFPSHAIEAGAPLPTDPIMAPITPGNAVVANGANILLPSEAPDFVDYEGELAVIIGRRCHEVDEKDASKYVLGVTACIDLSMRDEQFRGLLSIRAGNKDVNLGDAKKFNGSKPLGPEILLLDDGDVSALDLELTTHVNGELRQSGRTTELLFSISRLIAEASAKSPLEPGDIISTGTPAGVGMARGVFLEKGDRVDVRLGGMEPLSVTFV